MLNRGHPPALRRPVGAGFFVAPSKCQAHRWAFRHILGQHDESQNAKGLKHRRRCRVRRFISLARLVMHRFLALMLIQLFAVLPAIDGPQSKQPNRQTLVLPTETVVQVTVERVEALGGWDEDSEADIKAIIWIGQVAPFGHELRMFRSTDFGCNNHNILLLPGGVNDPRCSLRGASLPWVAQYPVLDRAQPVHIRIELWDEDKQEDAGTPFGNGPDDPVDINPQPQRRGGDTKS